MVGNVIDSRNRFRKNAQESRGMDPTSIEEQLLRASRLSASDKAAFAINLGDLAARIDKNDPLAGVRRICNASGLEGIWDKRKRFFRIPGEEAPVSSRDGEYGSRPSTFLNLAKAAGQLLAGTNRDEIVQAERMRAVRALVLGSSFSPNFEPSDSGDRTAKSLLDHYASAVCDAVETTRLGELWKTLETAPFCMEVFDKDEILNAPPSQYGAAADVPTPLLRPFFRDHIVAARFDTQNEWVGTDWSNPTIALGLIAIRSSTRMFAIPPSMRDHFSSRAEEDDGCISLAAREWLNQIGFANGEFPEIEFNPKDELGWRHCQTSSLRRVGLEISKGEDGRPGLQLVMWGDHRVACAWSYLSPESSEQQIANFDGRMSQARYVELEEGTLFDAICSKPFDLTHEMDHPPVMGIMPSEIEDYEVQGWTESEEVFGLLTTAQNPFYPTIPQADPLNGPIIANAVGAALLENARSASDENNIARQLVARARLTADAGLRFHEAMIDAYRDAIRRI